MATVKISELPSGQVVGNIVNSTQTIKANPTDGASAVVVTLNSGSALANASAKLLSVQNNSVEMFYIDKNGGFRTGVTNNPITFDGGVVSGVVIMTTVNANSRLNSTGYQLSSDNTITWYSSTQLGGSADSGFARYAPGVIKSTDASTGIRGLLGGGTAVASATAMPLPTGRVFHVTGTTTITSITSTNFASGAVITLIFDGVLTFTDGNNLKLAGNFVTSADDTITLVYDGSNWYEMCRSAN